MYISLLISCTFIIIIMFFSLNKKLCPLENVFLWLVIAFLNTTSFDVLVTNYKYIELSKNIVKAYSVRFLELTIFPIILIAFYNTLLLDIKKIHKIALNFITLILLVLLENIMDYLSLIKHLNWSLFKMIIFWQIQIIITYYCLKIFRNILKKEVNS